MCCKMMALNSAILQQGSQGFGTELQLHKIGILISPSHWGVGTRDIQSSLDDFEIFPD
jgi:hypothetical protein